VNKEIFWTVFLAVIAAICALVLVNGICSILLTQYGPMGVVVAVITAAFVGGLLYLRRIGGTDG
jgi:uncharacterized membrane-anchored protein